jgi:GT2 family glycosyltransferase
MALLGRILRALPLILFSPVLFLVPPLALFLTDLAWFVAGRRRPPRDSMPDTTAASVVIPNWNGRDLLAKYLPSLVVAMQGNPRNEIIVVDNGSSDDSVQLMRDHFPQVKVVALPENLGFGGGSNAGFRAAKNDIVVLLNSDMRVETGFLQPLLDCFTNDKIFSASCQIFFSDPEKKREETGLTQAWWENGGIRVRHRIDDAVREPFPCFYGGGGSCAFDRRKFLELGGFDELLRPFYMEDTDIGYLAWKRGWRALYQPASIVYHEHRGTIGKKFSAEYIQSIVLKNFLVFTWKNIHGWPRLAGHFFFAAAGSVISVLFGETLERPSLPALARAFVQLPTACRSRWRALSLAVIDDSEAFRRPLGGYYRDRFAEMPVRPDPLRVLFVSPYPICPPVHGGAVFMYQTTRKLAQLCDLHLVVLLEAAGQEDNHTELAAQCGSAVFLNRLERRPRSVGSILPHAVHEFASHDVEWAIHRQIYCQKIDAVQLEYLPMGQYRCDFHRIGMFLFEHDIYFQSIERGLGGRTGLLRRASAGFEYLRALRYELRLLPKLDRVQVCSSENGRFLTTYLPGIKAKLDDGLRAGIDASLYTFTEGPREPYTMLFLGSFRHLPNMEALKWFAREVMPRVLKAQPAAKLIVYGSEPPPRHFLPDYGTAIDLRGFAEEIHTPLAANAVFLCPILSGSGVRVKLLEAFASGIPVVSTRLGAEGLSDVDGELCALADDPESFANHILDLFDRPDKAAVMASRARKAVEERWDMTTITQRLADSYHKVVEEKRRRT